SVTSEAAVAVNFLKEASPLSSIHDVYAHLHGAQKCFPDILTVLQIAMTIGITTASAERSFSSLRRLKSYLRSTMSQERLNHLSLLHIERDLSTKLWDCLDEVVIKFADSHKNSRVLLR
uniref:HAT C-terminal dimerisation domain-containing protein n=1 Tax=Amphimedon queenslandica TaxID=400682 RepID=A0A1X7ST17_AMPQE